MIFVLEEKMEGNWLPLLCFASNSIVTFFCHGNWERELIYIFFHFISGLIRLYSSAGFFEKSWKFLAIQVGISYVPQELLQAIASDPNNFFPPIIFGKYI